MHFDSLQCFIFENIKTSFLLRSIRIFGSYEYLPEATDKWQTLPKHIICSTKYINLRTQNTSFWINESQLWFQHLLALLIIKKSLSYKLFEKTKNLHHIEHEIWWKVLCLHNELKQIIQIHWVPAQFVVTYDTVEFR